MLNDPPTSAHGLSPAPFEQKVYHVALPVCISVAIMGVMGFDGLQADVPQLLRIGARRAQGCGEHAGFMFPLVMLGIQAVVAQLTNVHCSPVGMLLSVISGHHAMTETLYA